MRYELDACLTPYFEEMIRKKSSSFRKVCASVSYISLTHLTNTELLCAGHYSNWLDTLGNKTGKLPAFLELTFWGRNTYSSNVGNMLII